MIKILVTSLIATTLTTGQIIAGATFSMDDTICNENHSATHAVNEGLVRVATRNQGTMKLDHRSTPLNATSGNCFWIPDDGSRGGSCAYTDNDGDVSAA